jgi:L-aminopeptidase/D-esterase-like protein
MAYQACLNATTDPIVEGSVGAGTGATVGKILGMPHAIKSGVGSACVEIVDGLFVGAIAVVNALGDVVDPRTGEIIAGARSEEGFADTLKVMQRFQALSSAPSASNTVIGVVATNAKLSKEEANKVAQMAHDGLPHHSSRTHNV